MSTEGKASNRNPAPATLPRTPCKGCGQNIAWVVMESGKRAPLDPDLVSFTVVGDDGRGRVVRGYVSHFATCPKAASFRGQGPKEV